MHPVVQEFGRLVEIVGDSLLSINDTVDDSAYCAVKMQNCLARYSVESAEPGFGEEIQIPVGIGYGKVRLSYGKDGQIDVVGRIVNETKRVEGGARNKPDQILLSDDAKRQLSEAFSTEPLDYPVFRQRNWRLANPPAVVAVNSTLGNNFGIALGHRVRRRGRPGLSPVCSPSSRTIVPLTITYAIPVLY
ncbi:MAG: hypothetical protein IH991_06545 [Planctomycetes bacterium]|nr:hypothetical protein [Planctomycetota bacterium]